MNNFTLKKSVRTKEDVAAAMAAATAGETMTSLLRAWQGTKLKRQRDEFVHALIAEVLVLRFGRESVALKAPYHSEVLS